MVNDQLLTLILDFLRRGEATILTAKMITFHGCQPITTKMFLIVIILRFTFVIIFMSSYLLVTPFSKSSLVPTTVAITITLLRTKFLTRMYPLIFAIAKVTPIINLFSRFPDSQYLRSSRSPAGQVLLTVEHLPSDHTTSV